MPAVIREDAARRAAEVRLLLMDVDGVLTDGRLLVGPDGGEWKAFHARDGLGIRLAQHAGLTLGVVSGRRSRAVERRCAELGLKEVHQGIEDKVATVTELARRYDARDEQIAYFGDDLVDAPVMRRCGLAVTVPEAPVEIRDLAHVVTACPGGGGAVREVIELLLRARGLWGAALERYGLAEEASR